MICFAWIWYLKSFNENETVPLSKEKSIPLAPTPKIIPEETSKSKCSKYAVAFYGYLRGSYYTSQFWQHYFLNTARMPPIDSFYHGPNEIWDRDNLSGKPENQVTDSYMYSMLGSSLRAFGTHKFISNDFKALLKKHNVLDEFPLLNQDGSPWFHQYASRSLSTLTNIAHLAQMLTNYTKTHCDKPYSHVLVTRLDLLLYGYLNLPVTPSNIVTYIEGNGYDLRGPGNIRRNLHLPFQFDGSFRRDVSAIHFNDQMVWIPWAVFEKLTKANVAILNAWSRHETSPNMESSLYYLLKNVGLAEHILPYDIVPFTIYRGPGERDTQTGGTGQVPPFTHQASVEKESSGWVDMETCPLRH
jgi:hypothetical protein